MQPLSRAKQQINRILTLCLFLCTMSATASGPKPEKKNTLNETVYCTDYLSCINWAADQCTHNETLIYQSFTYTNPGAFSFTCRSPDIPYRPNPTNTVSRLIEGTSGDDMP